MSDKVVYALELFESRDECELRGVPLSVMEVNDPVICPHCSSPNVSEKEEHSTFDYGVGVHAMRIEVKQPVIRCADCGEAFTDWRGEDARSAALLAHFQRVAHAAPPRGLLERVAFEHRDSDKFLNARRELGDWLLAHPAE